MDKIQKEFIEKELYKLNIARLEINRIYKDIEKEYVEGVNFLEKYCIRIKKLKENIKIE